MTQLSTKQLDTTEPTNDHTRRLPFRFRWSLILIGTLMVAIFAIQLSHTRSLKIVASEIRIGDDIFQVDELLGGSAFGYESGWPSPGAPPTVRCTLYGGPFDNLHESVDSMVSRVLGGPQMSWYTNMLSKQINEWPVRVRYDGSNQITAVYRQATGN